MSRDGRSPEAVVYRKWYRTYRWQQRRALQLAVEPLCANCLKHGRVTAATVADHIEPHKGDYDKFWHGPLQSLCDAAPWRCHSSIKQSQERGTRAKRPIGPDGWPMD